MCHLHLLCYMLLFLFSLSPYLPLSLLLLINVSFSFFLSVSVHYASFISAYDCTFIFLSSSFLVLWLFLFAPSGKRRWRWRGSRKRRRGREGRRRRGEFRWVLLWPQSTDMSPLYHALSVFISEQWHWTYIAEQVLYSADKQINGYLHEEIKEVSVND